MAEEFSRNNLYNYVANSNLVLASERDHRRKDESKGEVETLNGKLDNVRMGERLSSKQLEEDKQAERKKRIRDEDEFVPQKEHKSSAITRGSSIIDAADDLDINAYTPKTKETKEVYEELLRTVQLHLGNQPRDILIGAAQEILSILKDDSIRDSSKQSQVEKILVSLKHDQYFKIVNIGKRITDFHTSEADKEEGDNVMGEDMAVVFDDDSADERDLDHDRESGSDSDNDEDGGVNGRQRGGIVGKNNNDPQEGDADKEGGLSVHDIDAHWLQRQLSKHFSDANVTDKLADEILEYLREDDERVCENNLVGLLEYDKFDLVRLLLRNRTKIHYCIRLKRCTSEEEKSVIENEMMQDSSGEGLELLSQIKHKQSAEHWTQDRIGEFANKARREVKALNKDTSGPDNLKVVDDNDEDVVPDKRRLNASAAYVGDVKVVLEDLQFNDGNHLMTNTKCELPPNSWRASKKGYEEVHVPALKPVIPAGERLVEIADLPDWVQPAFPKMRSLNRVQSKMLDAALKGSDNLLLCAPTGAGKTNVALLCMLNQLGNYQREDGSFDLESFKMVYIAPMKALVQEIVQSFSKRLEPFGVKVAELSGDQNLTKQQIQDTQLIVTTPEKWDIITRKSGDRTFTQLVRLVIIDEIHLLHDDRGPVLEALVARIIRQIESTQEMVRLVGLSATLPNYQDVATFLRVKPDKGLFFFDNSYRPVPLQQQYIGVTEKKALKRFQLMNEVCYEKVLAQAGKNQVLIFTHSRAETVKTASALRDLAQANDTLNKFVREDSASLEILKTEAQTAKSGDLKDLLPFGFAVHHAGMVRSDRTLVEDLFADKHIQVLVSTATLAWGVNLPCHTVIIKGTQMYSPELGRWVELSPLDIMQMLGRAGRYGLDTEGEGIIMTSHSELQYYLSLMNMQLPVESQFIKKLPDMLNAEVVLGAVTSVSEAATWLGYTYLYVRMLKNPALYGISKDDILDDPTLLRRRLALVHAAAHTLDSHGLIKYDRKAGTFAATILGRVASHYYVSHKSIDVFNQHLKPSITEIELFRLFSLSEEFSQIRVREEEKQELSKLILRVPIPVKETVEEPSAKVNVLLQSYISRLTLEGFALVADMTYVQQSACRLMRALFDIALKRGWAALASKLLTVCKMVEKRIWGSQSPLRQFGNIPEVIIRKLEKNSDIVWDRYFDLTPQDLGEIVKIPKMGKTLHKFVHKFPKMSVNAHILPLTRALLRIDLTLSLDFEFDPSLHESNMLFWIVVEDVDGENILHHEAFILNGNYSTDAHYVNFTVQMQDPMPPQYFVKVVSDRWLHCETILPISFRNLLLPQKFPMPTELLDLQLLPVKATNEPAFQELFPGFKNFNPIQTQTFNALHNGDDNVLVCAPTGSGKTVCAEIALVRLFSQNSSAKCVYVAPKKELVETIYADWSLRLSKSLGVTVVMLTGESTTDLALLNAGNVVVSTSVHWDMISRRWKQRKAIQNIAMYVFDELHLVGGAEGGAFEIVISRARYVASQLDRSVRIVGLSTSLSNSKDVADWIGATHENTFNFAPSARPVALEIHIQTFETNQFSSRMLSMAKPAYTAIRAHAARSPAIVFVPSRKQAQLSAIDFLSFAGASGEPRYFLGENASSMLAQYLPLIKDKTVAQVVSQGVGYLQPNMSRFDISILETLFISGVIQFLVVPHTMCWSVTVFAKLVVVMDTVYYEGREHRYLDYSISDVLQMIGRASRQGFDRSAKAVILCHSPKREYLKKLLHDPLPIESHLDHCLHDHMNAEIVMKTIENKADAVDYLTWTFFYRRLTQNPNYYNLMGFSHRHLSDHLSELVETTVTDLENSKCIEVENDMDVVSLNIGMIASHYYIEYTTVELFAASVTAKTKVKGVLDILSAASEFSHLAIRQGEVKQLRKLSLHVPFTLASTEDRQLEDSSSKASLLLQCHFSRFALSNELVADQTVILKESVKLLQALVDVVSSQGYLRPALAAMEMSQMIVQGLWNKDSVLLQIPHFTSELVDELAQLDTPVSTVFDVIDLDDEVRNKVMARFSADQISDVATFCNAYPSVDVSYQLSTDEVEAGDSVLVEVVLRRDNADEDISDEDRAELGKVVCPRFPAGTDKKESWWLAVGDPNANNLIAIKRILLLDQLKVKIEFSAPELPGDYSLVLYVMCDSYLGCDQEYEFSLNVTNKN